MDKVYTEEELFENALFWRKENKKITNILNGKSETKLSQKELEDRQKYCFYEMEKAEKALFDSKKGLYVGIAYDLNEDSNPKPYPLYIKWKALHSHMGVVGTTRVGKTQNMLSHIEQCIANDMNVIVVDPKGGQGQDVLSSVIESCYLYEKTKGFSYFSPAYPQISERINILYGQTNIEITSDIINSIKTPTTEAFYIEIGERILMGITTSLEYLQECSDPTGEITRELERIEMQKYHQFKNKNFDNVDADDIFKNDVVSEIYSNDINDIKIDEFVNFGFNRTLITYKDLAKLCSYQELLALKNLVEVVEPPEVPHKHKIETLREEALLILSKALSAKEEYFEKTANTLSIRLTLLSTGPIGELLCSIRINPLYNSLTNPERSSISVIQPFPMKFKGASVLFVKMLLGMLNSMMGTVGAEGNTLPRRIALFIDEAGSVMFPGIEDFFNRAGGLGISVFVYTQANEDYDNAVGSILSKIIDSNINNKIIMRTKSYETAELESKKIGTIQTHKTLTMISSGGHDGRFSSVIQEEYLCSPKVIYNLPVGEGIASHENGTSYVDFTFRNPPRGVVKMPKLKTEAAKRELANFARELEKLEAIETILLDNEEI